MNKLIDLVRDYRKRRATAEEEGEITMEVIDEESNHLGGSERRGKTIFEFSPEYGVRRTITEFSFGVFGGL